jgi:hypothetical protein
MTTERFPGAPILLRARRAIVRRSRSIIPLAVMSLAVFAASAQAHTVTATATCKSVTFDWAYFSSSGSGNKGLNTPEWAIVFQPAGGSMTRMHGLASFAGSSSSLTVAIPSGDGAVTASSSWSSAQTRDGTSNSGTDKLTIANCPVEPPPAVEPPPVVELPPAVEPPPLETPASPVAHPSAVPHLPGALTLSTTGSSAKALSRRGSSAAKLGGTIRDTALVSGGSSPTGTLTFALYSASDLTCSKVLRKVSVVVSGDGSYESPPVTPSSAGSYQWVASYSGDAHNNSVSAACFDPAERSIVAQAICHSAPVAVRGLSETVRNSVSAYVAARGVKSVTFYIDGRRLVTLSKPSHRRFSVTLDARKFGFGAHTLTAKVTMLDPGCATSAVAGTFIHVKPISIHPQFAG